MPPTDIAAKSRNRLRLAFVVALGLLAALLLFAVPVHAQSAPVFTSGDTTISVAENTLTTTVLATYVATDADMDTLTWAVTGADADEFTITKDTMGRGELKFSSSPNYESPADDDTNNVYELIVVVSDDESTPMLTVRLVTVTVTDVNEAPTITQGPSSISKPEGTATTETIATYGASDADASTTFTWTLEGDDAGDFAITKNNIGHGLLTFHSVPDYESPADTGANNVYNATLRVSDGSLSDTYDFIVTVTNVVADDDQAGTVTITGTLSGGSTLTASVTDPDGTVSGLTWRVGAGGHGRGDVLEHQRGEQRHVHDRARRLGQVPAGDGVVHGPPGFRQVRQRCAGAGGGRQRRADIQ